MKTRRFSRKSIAFLFTIILVLVFYPPISFAQDAPQWERDRVMTHGGVWVSSVSFSPDSQTLASGGADKTIRLWDVETGRHLRTLLTEHQFGGIKSVLFSPDGQTLASGGEDNTIRLSEVEAGRHLQTLTGHTNAVSSVSFSPDGQTLASGSEDNTIRLWDVETGRHLQTLTGHTDTVKSVSFSPDGQTLASGGTDKTVRLWDVETGRHLQTLTGHTRWVSSVSFSPDEQTLASGGIDSIRLWDARTGRFLRRMRGPAGILSISFSPDGQTLASGSSNETIRLWDVETGRSLQTLREHLAGVRSVSFSLDGQTLASADNKFIMLWKQDLEAVEGHAAPASVTPFVDLTPEKVEQVLDLLRAADDGSLSFQRGIANLERLLATFMPEKTALLHNYPNPFNPETWIPYQLAKPAEVTVSIYAIDGKLVRTLALGYQAAGIYQHRSRAAYWDGRNNVGESVASGFYFYTLTAGNFSATRRMLILK